MKRSHPGQKITNELHRWARKKQQMNVKTSESEFRVERPRDSRIVVNVGGTSIKCTLYNSSTEKLDLRILGFGLKSLWVYENRVQLPFESSTPSDAIAFAANRMIEFVMNNQLLVTQVCHRIKYFRPSPLCFRIDDLALAEIREYGFLQASHSDSLLAALDVFMSLFPQAEHIAVPDHALLAGTGVLQVDMSVPRSMLRRFGLFAIPQHGYAVRSALGTIGHSYVANTKGVMVCHIGSGVTVSFVREGLLRSNSMLYSSCDGPLMTYRTGNLPMGMMLRLCKDPDNDVMRNLFTSGGLYARISADDSITLSVADIIDNPTYEKQTRLYVTSIIEAILSCIADQGFPERFVFAGNLLTRSEHMFALLVSRLSAVFGRRPIKSENFADGNILGGQECWHFSYASINEEVFIDKVLGRQTKAEIDENGCVEHFNDDASLNTRLHQILGRREGNIGMIQTGTDGSDYEAFTLSAGTCTSVFDSRVDSDATPEKCGLDAKMLYIDRRKRFVHLFKHHGPIDVR
jgi:acetate kinase